MLPFRWKMSDLKPGIKRKRCAKCNTEFTCSDSGNSCWCNQHKLSTEQLDYLKENYNNCLCENCLRRFSNLEKT